MLPPVDGWTRSDIMKDFLLKVVVFLIVSAAVSLTSACGRQERLHIAVSQCSNDDWREQLNEEIRREIMLHNEAEVEICSADDSIAKQIADIERFIADKVDIIIVAPIEAKALTPVIKKAYDGGIPVILFDREVEGEAYTAYLGSDNALIGANAASWLIANRPGGGKVMELIGLEGSTPAIQRHEGFAGRLAGQPGFEIAATAHGDWTGERGYELADSILSLRPDIDVIFAQNDRMAIAARKAADRHGLKNMVIIGVDAVPQTGIKAVTEGVIDATFLYPTGGKQLIDIAFAILEGRPYERETVLYSANPVDSTNAGILMLQAASLDAETAKIDFLKRQVDDYSDRHSAQTGLLYAIIVILLLLSGWIFMLLHSFWARKRHQALLSSQNDKLKEQRDELISLNRQLSEATRAKLAFFTNVSHDLRTPLTLIADPVDRIKDAPNLDDRQRVMMTLASKNVKILMRLINQILDFNKYESGKLPLSLSEEPLLPWATEVVDRFKPLALNRHIRLTADFSGVPRDLTVAMDVNKMERVCYNLLSNAFKFTPQNGTIAVSVMAQADNVVITVADSGCGMNTAEVRRVFERFYQADSVQPGGSGIGLAVAKSFVNLHDGDITVESTPGKGTIFTVTIPLRHLDSTSTIAEPVHVADAAAVADELGEVEAVAILEGDDTDRPTVLIIDDNPDIRTLLRTRLGEEYKIMSASDGRQGIKLASKYIPDLVICDVMMPGMDGMECCSRLKTETSTSHIPVLMLTACSLDRQRVEGYENGADGYLSKPFSSDVLLARCRSLIANRKRVMESAGPAVASGKSPRQERRQVSPSSLPANDIDNEFYARFLSLIEKEMGNSELSVEEMGNRLGLSRVQFYRKIKALTNYSPNELVRNIRLNRAKQLLTSTESTVSEVAYSVGFSSPSYFAKCFKEYFGELPADVQKRTSKITGR